MRVNLNWDILGLTLVHCSQLSTDDEADADDDDDDSEVEHCYGPGKLRNAQSTLELERER